MRLQNLKLLPKDLLVRTSDVDHADWNYRLLLGRLQRVRFQLALSLLVEAEGSHLLEVGYGSGVFIPELGKTWEYISGIDIHQFDREVANSLEEVDILADLRSGSVTDMPFASGSFDVALAVSSLEYVEDIDNACAEITRVLKESGSLIIVTPAKSAMLDFGLKMVGNEDAERNYGGRREVLVSAIRRHFDSRTELHWPSKSISVYKALRLQPKK